MKLVAYARDGIPVYWIVNLVDRQVEVYARPVKAGRYRSRRATSRPARASRGRRSAATPIAVNDILPWSAMTRTARRALVDVYGALLKAGWGEPTDRSREPATTAESEPSRKRTIDHKKVEFAIQQLQRSGELSAFPRPASRIGPPARVTVGEDVGGQVGEPQLILPCLRLRCLAPVLIQMHHPHRRLEEAETCRSRGSPPPGPSSLRIRARPAAWPPRAAPGSAEPRRAGSSYGTATSHRAGALSGSLRPSRKNGSASDHRD